MQGLFDNPTVDDAFQAVHQDVVDLPDNIYQVSDLKSTMRSSLGDKWLLCNGDVIPKDRVDLIKLYDLGFLGSVKWRQNTEFLYSGLTDSGSVFDCSRDQYFINPDGELCTLQVTATADPVTVLLRKATYNGYTDIDLNLPSAGQYYYYGGWAYVNNTLYIGMYYTYSASQTNQPFRIYYRTFSKNGNMSSWGSVSTNASVLIPGSTYGEFTAYLFSSNDILYVVARKRSYDLSVGSGTGLYSLMRFNGSVSSMSLTQVSSATGEYTGIRRIVISSSGAVVVQRYRSTAYSTSYADILYGTSLVQQSLLLNHTSAIFAVKAGNYIYFGTATGTYYVKNTSGTTIYSGTTSNVFSSRFVPFVINNVTYFASGCIYTVTFTSSYPYYTLTQITENVGLNSYSNILVTIDGAQYQLGNYVQNALLPTISIADGVNTFIKAVK